jgi:hypothetical protein
MKPPSERAGPTRWHAMRRPHLSRPVCLVAGAAFALLFPHVAHAIPAFATQTGQPCASCHIGSFGPQLTPFGQAFKIEGYTETGGQGWQAQLPVSVMLLGSYTDTQKGQGAPASQHYGSNGNFAMDQISAFVGGRISDYAGGLVQGTFDGVASAISLDNTDLRFSYPFSFNDAQLRAGVDVNNGPTVQDPYNASYAWGYPYVSSALAPTPAAQPLLAGGLIGNSIGVSAYAWYNRAFYVEAGLYNTYGPSLLRITGSAYGPGSTSNPAPYLRAAYEWNFNGQSAYVGGIFLHSNINPATESFSSDGSQGHDSYTDYAVDGGYQFLGTGTNVIAIAAIFDHEQQHLNSSFNTGAASQASNTLNQARWTASYYYQQTYGVTAGWQKTWGSANPLLYAPAPLTGSANGSPDSNAFTFEADWVPFGKYSSWASPWVNLKLGAEYTLYTQFNGSAKNYDGFGRSASDNNTLFLFAWLLF